jgi:hypothetical protein
MQMNGGSIMEHDLRRHKWQMKHSNGKETQDYIQKDKNTRTGIKDWSH